MFTLNDEERAIVEVVADFVDREVRPVARDLEHANAYPEHLIARMKELGVYGLAVPEPYGESAVSKACYALVTEELARGWMSLAGAFGGHRIVCGSPPNCSRPQPIPCCGRSVMTDKPTMHSISRIALPIKSWPPSNLG